MPLLNFFMFKPHRRTVRLAMRSLTIALVVVWLLSGLGTASASLHGAAVTIKHGQIGVGWLPPGQRVDETYWLADGEYTMRWWFSNPPSRGGFFILSPMWPAVIAGVGITLVAARKFRDISPGCCSNCEFDLAGLPAGGRCPECGVAVVFACRNGTER